MSDTSMDARISAYYLLTQVFEHHGDAALDRLVEFVKARRKLAETEFLEFKSSILPESDESQNEINAARLGVAKCIFALANTSGGVLVIGVEDDLKPCGAMCDRVERAVGLRETDAFLRREVCQKLLPDQMTWRDGKGRVWNASALPAVMPRVEKYAGRSVVCLLVQPQPAGHMLRLECAETGEELLLTRKLGFGSNARTADAGTFNEVEFARVIFRPEYLEYLKDLCPSLQGRLGGAGGRLRLQPSGSGGMGRASESLLARMAGHELCCDFRPDDLIGGYRVESPIAEGGMARVYEVKGPGGRYALKAFKAARSALDEDAERRLFVGEALLLREIRNGNVPRYVAHGFDPVARCLYCVMQLVGGAKKGGCRALGHYRVGNGGECSVDEFRALKWLLSTCEVLSDLHEQGILHRDLSPGNILISRRRKVFLVDFGIAKAPAGSLPGKKGYTIAVTQGFNADRRALGTPDFIAPEVLEEGAPFSERSDVWSVGCSFFTLVTGRSARYQQFSDPDLYNNCPRTRPVWQKLFEGMLKPVCEERFTCQGVIDTIRMWQRQSAREEADRTTTEMERTEPELGRGTAARDGGVVPMLRRFLPWR